MLGRSGTRLLALLPFAIGFWFGVKFMLGAPIFMRAARHSLVDHFHAHPKFAVVFFALALVSYSLYGVTAWGYCYISARMVFPRIVEGTIESVRKPRSRSVLAFASVILDKSGKEYRVRMRNLGALNPDTWVGQRARLGVGAFPFRTAYFIEVED
jgi:hypothetical protein